MAPQPVSLRSGLFDTFYRLVIDDVGQTEMLEFRQLIPIVVNESVVALHVGLWHIRLP